MLITCLNRTFMELKYKKNKRNQGATSRLNRTFMELKFGDVSDCINIFRS